MFVKIPIGWMHMDFNIAPDMASARLDQQGGIQKIRTRLQIPNPWIQHRHGFIVGEGENCRPIPRIKPEALQMPFAPMETSMIPHVAFLQFRFVS
jgi:hypothetical protein